jgi:hypothetical protein
MSFHFAYGRTVLDSADWSITVNNDAGSLTATTKYFSLQGQNPVGKNQLLISAPITIPANSSVTINIASTALTEAEGWTHFVIGVSNTNTPNSFNQIARIPIFNHTNGDINISEPKLFPLTITFTHDLQITSAVFVENYYDLPTSNLVYGMRIGVTELDNTIYEYNPHSTATPNGTSIIEALLGNWIQKSTFSTYIANINSTGGCARNLLGITDFTDVEYVNYDADGNQSLSTLYYIVNDSGTTIQPNTGITPTIQLSGIDRTELFDNKVFYEIYGVVNKTTGELRTENSITNAPFEYLEQVQTYSKNAPYVPLTDYLQPDEAILIRVYLRFMGVEFNNLLPTGYFQINFGFIAPQGNYNVTGSLFEKGVIFNKFNNRRIYAGLSNTAIIGEGSGIVKNFSWYSCNSTVFDLADNTAEQKLYVNKNGIVFIDTAEKNDTVLRGIVDTTPKESILSLWSDYTAIAEDGGISVLVNYDADDDLNLRVRANYPDVIADDWAILNASGVNIYVQKQTGGEIRKFSGNLIAPTNGLQEFLITDWENGVVVAEIDLPDVEQSFFNPVDNDVAAETGIGNFAADNYRVAHSYYWNGETISDITHSTSLGCVAEALLGGEEVFGGIIYSTKTVIKALTDYYEGRTVYCKETRQQYVYHLTGDFIVDNTYVFQPDDENGYWVSTLYFETHSFPAEIAPTTDDDETLGYKVGDRWLDTVEAKEYTLVDATEGAAIWKEVGGGVKVKDDGVELAEKEFINFGKGFIITENEVDNSFDIEVTPGKILLTEDLELYVAPDGNVENDGLTVETPIPFQTALLRCQNYIYDDYRIVINLEEGSSYEKGTDFSFNAFALPDGANVWIVGSSWVGSFAEPGVTIDYLPIYYAGSADIKIENIKITDCIDIDYTNAVVRIGNVFFDHDVTDRTCIFAGASSRVILFGLVKFGMDSPTAIAEIYDTTFLVTTTFDAGGFDIEPTTSYFQLTRNARLEILFSAITGTGTFVGKRFETLETTCYVKLNGHTLPGDIDGTYVEQVAKTSQLTAENITIDTTNFDNNLTEDDDTVQKALETLDDLIASTSGGHTIEEDGAPLTQRNTLNFVGSGITVTDDDVGEKTVVTISKSGINWLSEWDNATAYLVDDIVKHAGNVYIAVSNNTNKEPGLEPEWDLCVEKGDPGATGTVSAASGLTLEHIATPSDPDAGNTIVYAKSDGKIYKRPAGGSEEEIGSGGGANAYEDLSDVDITGLIIGQTMVWNGTVWIPGTRREVLTTDRTYYVRTDGSDSNNGLTNNSGGAFLTIQKAIDVASSLDLSIYNVVIQIVDGTYILSNSVVLKKLIGSGKGIIQGNSTTPSNVIIEGLTKSCFEIIGTKGTSWVIKDLKVQSTTSSSNTRACLFLSNADCDIDNIVFGAMPGGSFSSRHVTTTNKSLLRIMGSYSITGSANMHLLSEVDSTIDFRDAEAIAPITVTLTGTPSFSNGGFWWCASMGLINCFAGGSGLSFSGSATGDRYIGYYRSLILTNGGSSTFLPGSSSGVLDATSTYA